MRLIDADALFSALNDTRWYDYADKKIALDCTKDAFTVDAVPVVRCRDCKHSYYENGNGYDEGYFCLLQMYDEYEYEKVRPLGFCDMGERDERNNEAEN